jgi:hypothetical protein
MSESGSSPAQGGSGVVWIELFPWLLSSDVLDADSAKKWRSPVPQFGPELTRESALIASIAIEAYGSWSLSSLFPSVPLELHVGELALNVRALNVLRRHFGQTFADFAGQTITGLFQLRNAGAATIEVIIESLVRANLAFGLNSAATHETPDIDGVSPIKPESTSFERLGRALSASLDVVAAWQFARGAQTEPMLRDLGAFAVAPTDVMNALAEIMDLTAVRWTNSKPPISPVVELLAEHMQKFNEREMIIVRERILIDEPKTLDALGAELGVTRERVRQIESRIMAQLSSWIQDGTQLGTYSFAVRQRIATIAPLEAILTEMPELIHEVEATGQAAWYVFDKFDDSFESDGVWIAAPSLAEVADELRLRFDQIAILPGVAEANSIFEAVSDWTSLTRADLAHWLERNGYRSLKDHYISSSIRSIPDLAGALLAITGASLSAEEIQAEIAANKTLGSVKNALAADERFVRVGPSEWGLREWGNREYSGIRDAITALVESLGEVQLDDLIRDLTADFNVSPKSIAVYANSWPLQTVSGRVRFAPAPKTVRRSFSQTKNVYRLSDGWAIRFKVTTEHLRGSGFPMPSSFAASIGLSQGEKRTLDTNTGQLTISWATSQPSFGSVRKELVDLDASIDDEVVLEIHQDRARLRKLGEFGDDIGTKIRMCLGFEGEGMPTSAEVALAIGLAAESPWASSIHVLRDRGETALAEDLISVVGYNPAFDEGIAPSKPSRFTIVSIDDAS